LPGSISAKSYRWSGSTITFTGHYAGPKNIEDHLVYVAQTESGEHITLTPVEFEKKYGWKNDPKKARLLR
jgi:hypothetical protein